MRGILWDGQQVELDERLTHVDPGPNQVVVEVKAAGLCHSDLSVINGTYATLPLLPAVMGHEGAGVVVEVGSGVTTCQVGDHVVLTTIDACGRCRVCVRGRPTLCQQSAMGRAMAKRALTGEQIQASELPAHFRLGSQPVLGYANTGVFAERLVVGQNQTIVIDGRVPFTSACLMGCGVMTGTGAVFNRAKVYRGDTVAVIGGGGVGLNVIQAARIAGATRIVAVDSNPAKEVVARQFGATDFVPSIEHVLDVLRGGADHVFECVGKVPLIEAAIGIVAPGGNAVIVGVPGLDATVAFKPQSIYQDKTIMGTRAGTCRPADDIPALVDLYLDGRLLLDELVTCTYPLDGFERAFHDLDTGVLAARGVLVP